MLHVYLYGRSWEYSGDTTKKSEQKHSIFITTDTGLKQLRKNSFFFMMIYVVRQWSNVMLLFCE